MVQESQVYLELRDEEVGTSDWGVSQKNKQTNKKKQDGQAI